MNSLQFDSSLGAKPDTNTANVNRNVNLPRLVVIGDVYPNRSTSGDLILYRLLRSYPPERLLIVHNAEIGIQEKTNLLPNVEYRRSSYKVPRLILNRFNPAWPIASAIDVRRTVRNLAKVIGDFRPAAVLEVAHSFLWLAGAAFARRKRIPLHLILHDDWTTTMCGPGWHRILHRGMEWAMRSTYRQAQSRLCVSPGMADYYRRRFGVTGHVLYPNRGDDSPLPCVRVRDSWAGPPVIAYAGHIHFHQKGVTILLGKLASLLATMNGRLDIYTKIPAARLVSAGLNSPNIRIVGFFPSPAEMAEHVVKTAHALFLPASFLPEEHVDTSTLFPSKLADYTAIGLPILIWGPAHCSAATWARSNMESNILITQDSTVPLAKALNRLLTDRIYAIRLATGAVEAGNRYFSQRVAQEILFSALAVT